MNGQNDKLEAEILRLGVEYRFPVKLGTATLYLRALSINEMLECHNKVSAYMETLPKSARSSINESASLAREFLKAASSPFGEFAPGITDLHLDKMTNGQVMALYKEWQKITDQTNPELEKIDPQILKDLVEDLKKNPPEDLDSQLTELSFSQLRNMVQYLLTKGD